MYSLSVSVCLKAGLRRRASADFYDRRLTCYTYDLEHNGTSGMKSPSVPKLPPFEAPTLVFALFAVWSVVAYRASSPGYLLPAVLVALSAHLANKINRALRPLSKLELLPPDLPCNVARVESWLRARDQDEAPLEPGAESAVTWAVEEAKPTELCVVYLHGWGASPPELSPVPEQLAAALGANLLRYR